MSLADNTEKITDEFGWKHMVLNAESDIQKQVDLVRSAISQKVVGMFIHSLDDEVLTGHVADAIDAGIYVYISTTGVADYIDQEYLDSGFYCILLITIIMILYPYNRWIKSNVIFLAYR